MDTGSGSQDDSKAVQKSASATPIDKSQLPRATQNRLAAVAKERAEAKVIKEKRGDAAVIQATGHVRIGDLLMFAGLVSYDFIQTALRNFEEQGLPLGKVLTLSGYVTELQLRAALDIQTLVNERQLPLEIGVKVLTLAYKEKIALADAFERSGVVQPEDHLSNKLGQLLLDARVVDISILDQALEVNQRTGLPLGHILCFRGVISQQLLETALLGQQLVRRGSISRDQCVKAINASSVREVEFEKLAVNISFERSMLRQSPRIGELLFEAELITDGQLLESLQNSLANARPSGEAMQEICGMESIYIAATVELQEMIDNGMLTNALAVDTFVRMKEFGQGYMQALAEASVSRILLNPSRDLLDLLSEAGAFNTPVESLPNDVRERVEVNYNQSIEVCRLLVAHNLVPEHIIYSGLRLIYLLDEEYLTRERALLALDMACRMGVAVDEAVFQLGWKKRTRLRDS